MMNVIVKPLISEKMTRLTEAAANPIQTRIQRKKGIAVAPAQNRYGFVGVKKNNGELYVVMQKAMAKGDAVGKEMERIPLTSHPSPLTSRIWLRVSCDFRNLMDKAMFAYSLDGKEWKTIGDTLQMFYDWPDFCGYRFALFHYATNEIGGIADFDYFRVKE